MVGNHFGTDLTGNPGPAPRTTATTACASTTASTASRSSRQRRGQQRPWRRHPGRGAGHHAHHDRAAIASASRWTAPRSRTGVRDRDLHGSRYRRPGNIIAFNPVGIRIGQPDTTPTPSRATRCSATPASASTSPRGRHQSQRRRRRRHRPQPGAELPGRHVRDDDRGQGTACAGCTVEVFLADSAAGATAKARPTSGPSSRTPAAPSWWSPASSGVRW